MSELPPELPLTITIPTQHQRLLGQIRESTHCVKSFDPVKRTLTTLFWPTTGDRRVPPSELREYRNSNRFLGPCCLCPLFAVDGAFTEAAMFIETSGPFSGEYVAKCAKGECGFTVLLERIYTRTGVPGKRYPRRRPNEKRPPLALHHSEVEIENQVQQSNVEHRDARRSLKRKLGTTDLNDRLSTPRRALGPSNRLNVEPPAPRPNRVLGPSNPLQQLSSPIRPGLTSAEFRDLFSRCGACSLVMTREVFGSHECRDVIDLTTDSEPED